MSLTSTANKLFGRYTTGKSHHRLQEALKKARMPVSADMYMATAMFSGVLAGIGGAVGGLLISILLGLEAIFIVVIVAIVSSALGALTYYLVVSYPGMTAGERGRKVDAALPFTIGFMHSMSKSGAGIAEIFKELSGRRDVGALRQEAQVFMRDVEYLGQDPLTALRNLAATTPSKKFASFLDVLVSIIETGGDVTPYMSTKTLELHSTMKEENKRAVTSLEFMAEIYVIMVAFMPLLFLAILIFMGFLPGQSINPSMLQVLVYGWVPISSVAFSVIIATTSPVEIKSGGRAFKLPSPYGEVVSTAGDQRDTRLVKKLRGSLAGMKARQALANPFAVLIRNPAYTFLISAPIAIFFLVSTPVRTLTLFMTFLVAFVPYTVAYEFRSRRVQQIDSALPDFLKSLTSASKSGLTLSRALKVTSSANLGVLTDEVRLAQKHTEWGGSALEAVARLEQKLGVSPTAAKAMTLIRKASEAEENISDVVDITLNDVRTRQEIVAERNSAMFVYKLIILMTFFVFLATIYFIIQAYTAMPTGAVTTGQTTIQGIDPSIVKLLFYHLILLEAIFNGIAAGQMGSGDVRSGLKYTILLGVVAVLVFEFVLMPLGPPSVISQE
jgi:flagellar protein FlaJ